MVWEHKESLLCHSKHNRCRIPGNSPGPVVYFFDTRQTSTPPPPPFSQGHYHFLFPSVTIFPSKHLFPDQIPKLTASAHTVSQHHIPSESIDMGIYISHFKKKKILTNKMHSWLVKQKKQQPLIRSAAYYQLHRSGNFTFKCSSSSWHFF